MEDKLLENIKKELGANNIQINFKVSERLLQEIERQAKDTDKTVPSYVRDVLIEYLTPAILEKLLFEEAGQWLGEQKKDSYIFNFEKRKHTLKKIEEMAKLAAEETENLRKKFIEEESSYLINLNQEMKEIKGGR